MVSRCYYWKSWTMADLWQGRNELGKARLKWQLYGRLFYCSMIIFRCCHKINPLLRFVLGHIYQPVYVESLLKQDLLKSSRKRVTVVVNTITVRSASCKWPYPETVVIAVQFVIIFVWLQNQFAVTQLYLRIYSMTPKYRCSYVEMRNSIHKPCIIFAVTWIGA